MEAHTPEPPPTPDPTPDPDPPRPDVQPPVRIVDLPPNAPSPGIPVDNPGVQRPI
ncbi:MAG: hypothetical protein M3373_00450 [Gemmatimonadota bacterium]|nr:hypothetical protein [Gemmatimonadota bacterium]